MKSWEAKNCLIIYNTLNAYKALQMSHTSYYNQQEPLNKNPLNHSEFAKNGKTEKTEKKPKKQEKTEKKNPEKPNATANLKFAVAFGSFFGLQPP